MIEKIKPGKTDKIKLGTIRFELRKEKVDKYGKVPIRLIFQIRSVREFYNTGEKTFPHCWNLQSQEAVFIKSSDAKKITPPININLLLTSSEADEINEKLNELRSKIEKIEKRFIEDSIIYDSDMVINALREKITPSTKKPEPTNILFDFIDKYIEDNSATRVPGSLTVYRSMKNHLQEYEKKNKKVTFDSIDYAFFRSFQKFLLSLTKEVGKKNVPLLNNTTIAKQLSTLKTFLSYAKQHGITVPDGYKDFKIKKDTLEVIALSSDEFETLYNLDLRKKEKLARVRDIFCFSCATGFRYSDLKQMRREHIKPDEIRLTVIKTGEILAVPLTPYSRAILAKYDEQRKPLPMISSGKLNVYIKELCEFAGINEPIEVVRFRGAKREAITYPKHSLIHIHTGRKTFVTLSLEKGMSAEQVMACTGHKDYQSFKRYINVTNQLKKVAMLGAWGRLKAV